MTDISFVIGEAPPPRLDKAIVRDMPEPTISRSALSRMIAQGHVQVNGAQEVNQKAKIKTGDEISIYLPPVSETHIVGEDIPLDIYFEDDQIIVVNKPAGMVVHPAPGTPSGTLVNALLAHCGDTLSGVGGVKRPGIVHRIDKDTSGLLVVAKTDLAHQMLSDQFRAHDVDRIYKAVCYGVPDAADPRLAGLTGISFERGGIVKITTRLDRHRTDRQRQAVKFDGGRHAVTRAKVIKPLANETAAVLECRLETGRTHQIRVHMSYAGHVLIGDKTYGGNRKLRGEYTPIAASFARQALHATTLGFIHPTLQKPLDFTAPPPMDMADLITDLSRPPAG